MSLSAFVTLFLAAFAVAVPTGDHSKTCNTSSATLDLPANQTNLTAPADPDLSFVALGVGFQNYTCNSTTGTYTSIGAKADLFDLSCLSQTNLTAFENIQDVAFALWSKSSHLKSVVQITGTKLGEHYFITSNGTLSPVWDFRADAAKNQPDAFVVAAKVGDLKAPTNSSVDVDWLELTAKSGDLATTIYRTDTRGGQPPASCTHGSSVLRVKYVAKYYLYGGKITLS